MKSDRERGPLVFLHGDSKDWHPHGGRDQPPPPIVNRRAQARATDHPSTDRWVTITTTRHLSGTYAYRVAVVDGFNRPQPPPAREFPTLRRARTAANKLYNALTEETDQ